MADPWLSGAAGTTAGPSDADQDTIALLQEEIARLEDELRIRDEMAAGAALPHPSGPDPRAQDEVLERDQRLETLAGELADREETIALLLEHLRLSEEAEAASRAEWEQLNRWVQEVERRIAERGEPGPDPGLRDELEAERRSSQAQRLAAEKEQRSWEVQRQALVTEVERLRSTFSRLAGESDNAVAAVQGLEHENRQLREAYDELARAAIPPHEMDALVAELQEARHERDTATQELKRALDDHQRERNEQEAALNALRSQLARESLWRQEEQVKAAALPATDNPLLEVDVRIRAFREHLNAIHQDETEQRMRRSLSVRLSRLWKHTGPGR